jgi:hypothetical protein
VCVAIHNLLSAGFFTIACCCTSTLAAQERERGSLQSRERERERVAHTSIFTTGGYAFIVKSIFLFLGTKKKLFGAQREKGGVKLE